MHIYTVKRIVVRVWVWNDIAHAIEWKIAILQQWYVVGLFVYFTIFHCGWIHFVPFPVPVPVCVHLHVHLCESMLYILQMMLVSFVIWNERSFSFGFASYFIEHRSARSPTDVERYACERVSSRISEALRIPILISIFWGLSPVELNKWSHAMYELTMWWRVLQICIDDSNTLGYIKRERERD